VLRVNKLGVRLLLAGGGCVLLGIAGFFDRVSGGAVKQVIGELVWKGPLLAAAGAGAAHYGYRLITDRGPGDPKTP
jgi:hypothetical protein